MLEDPVNQTHEQVAFRAELWKKFVASYQSVLGTAPETFSAYCEKFRERWIAGKSAISYKSRTRSTRSWSATGKCKRRHSNRVVAPTGAMRTTGFTSTMRAKGSVNAKRNKPVTVVVVTWVGAAN